MMKDACMYACISSFLLSLTACANLSIKQYSFQGDPARGRTHRLEIALGKALSLKHRKDDPLETAASCEFLNDMDQIYENLSEDPSIIRKNLFRCASELEFSPLPKDQRLGMDIKHVLRFPGFDQIELDEDNWKLINPVEVYGGFGETEFIIVRDDGGNYNLKSAAFDPSEVVAAGVNSALSVMQIVASAYGIPTLSNSAQTSQTNSQEGVKVSNKDFPLLKQHYEQTAEQLNTSASHLRDFLETVKSSLPAGNMTVAELKEKRTQIRNAITAYVQEVAVLSREEGQLQSLFQSLPTSDPRTRLALEFGKGSLSPKQTVALYWAYIRGVDSDPEEVLVQNTLGTLISFSSEHNPETRPASNQSRLNRTLEILDQKYALNQSVIENKKVLRQLENDWAALNNAATQLADIQTALGSLQADLTGRNTSNADYHRQVWEVVKQALENVSMNQIKKIGKIFEDVLDMFPTQIDASALTSKISSISSPVANNLRLIKEFIKARDELPPKSAFDRTMARNYVNLVLRVWNNLRAAPTIDNGDKPHLSQILLAHH